MTDSAMQRLRAGTKYLAGTALAVAVGVIVFRLAMAPLWGTYTPSQCREAYAHATSLGDTLRVDLRKYRGTGRMKSSCSELRAVAANVMTLQAPRTP